ncbi:MAG: protein kinase [Polyangiaceae bacterium]
MLRARQVESPDVSTWALGAVIGGRYILEGLLGKGGFGAVFKAREMRTREHFAVKILTRAAMAQPDAVARFRREAELAAALRNESTVRVVDWGDAGNGTPFIVFELLTGRSLEDLVEKEGALQAERALFVTLALLGSLEEAHARGIIHRDIKPGNVFLCDNPPGRIKLLDFGVAKSTLATVGEALTTEGLVVGTPAYMAPEQISGGAVSPATDLYATALVLAEMLTGKAVYDDSPLVVCAQKVRLLPPPFADVLLGSPFGALLVRATQPDPAARYASVADLRRALVATGVRPLAGAPQAGGFGSTQLLASELQSALRNAPSKPPSDGAGRGFGGTVPLGHEHVAVARRAGTAPIPSEAPSSALPSSVPVSSAWPSYSQPAASSNRGLPSAPSSSPSSLPVSSAPLSPHPVSPLRAPQPPPSPLAHSAEVKRPAKVDALPAPTVPNAPLVLDAGIEAPPPSMLHDEDRGLGLPVIVASAIVALGVVAVVIWLLIA